MILGGDIGGTKVLLGAAENGALIVERRYASADFLNFTDLLATFFTETQINPAQVHGGCLAVAGPIADDGCSARLTNLPWMIDCAELSRRFGLPPLQLANDFSAAALGAVTSSADQRVTLQAGLPLSDAPRLVVGAGTGLGMALVLPRVSSQNHGWHIIPSEGGHAAFAPADEEQLRLWQFLHARHGRVIWEHVVSGPGITAIHEFMNEETLPAEEISLRALATAHDKAYHSLELFLAAYGAFAGDMALACLARGGVFLAGGIVAKLMPLLPHSPFLTAFNAKAEHASIAAKMPIHVATDPALGLNGALRIAQNKPSR
ncbi:MAG: glucokinase [Rugosibacter sp.]|jgi:glucokinase|nr:glucokinase [Rugosibacter sp.]MDO9271683.1 glucokinase [Rugosibacter sp.]